MDAKLVIFNDDGSVEWRDYINIVVKADKSGEIHPDHLEHITVGFAEEGDDADPNQMVWQLQLRSLKD